MVLGLGPRAEVRTGTEDEAGRVERIGGMLEHSKKGVVSRQLSRKVISDRNVA